MQRSGITASVVRSVGGALVTSLVMCCSAEPVHPNAASSRTELLHFEWGGEHNVRMTEVERSSRTSTFQVASDTLESASDLGWYLLVGYYEAAKARGAKFFIGLREWKDADGVQMCVVGFADSERDGIQSMFGDKYALQDEAGRPRVFTSVVELEQMFAHAEYYRD